MSWFAIRRKSTGKLLPAPPVHQRGGQTHVSMEFDSGPPRLFPTAHGANVCMKLWLRGHWGPKKINWNNPPTHRVSTVQFSDSRQHLAEDMEVVRVDVQVLTKIPKKTSLTDDDFYA